MGSSHLLLYPIPTRPGWSHGENIWQPVPSVPLDASPKRGKTFECWQLYSQHDWYSDHKLHFLTKRHYKQKIWPSCLLVWFHWLFLKENSIWKLKIKTAAFCIAIDNRCPASNHNFPSIYTNISPLGLMANPPPACTDFVYFTRAAVALQSQCRDYKRCDSHRDAGTSLKVFPGCRWVPRTKAGDCCYWKGGCFWAYHALAVSSLDPNPLSFPLNGWWAQSPAWFLSSAEIMTADEVIVGNKWGQGLH